MLSWMDFSVEKSRTSYRKKKLLTSNESRLRTKKIIQSNTCSLCCILITLQVWKVRAMRSNSKKKGSHHKSTLNIKNCFNNYTTPWRIFLPRIFGLVFSSKSLETSFYEAFWRIPCQMKLFMSRLGIAINQSLCWSFLNQKCFKVFLSRSSFEWNCRELSFICGSP